MVVFLEGGFGGSHTSVPTSRCSGATRRASGMMLLFLAGPGLEFGVLQAAVSLLVIIFPQKELTGRTRRHWQITRIGIRVHWIRINCPPCLSVSLRDSKSLFWKVAISKSPVGPLGQCGLSSHLCRKRIGHSRCQSSTRGLMRGP